MKRTDLSSSTLCGWIAGSCVGAALIASTPVLAAGGEMDGRRDFADGQRMERVIPAGASVQPLRRFDDAGPVRRLDYSDSHGNRMTPEERRQLRRDIRDAARELYRDAPGQP